MFSTRNITIAIVVVIVAVVGYYAFNNSKPAPVAPAKPAVTQPAAPVKK